MLQWMLKSISLGRLGVAFILAILVWGYVIATQYPEETISFNNVSVSITGRSIDLIPRQYSTQVTKVTINGAKDKVTLVQPASIQPIIDLGLCTKPITCDIPIHLKQVPDNVSSFTIEPDSIQVQLEQEVSKELDIQINKMGTVKLGYQQDEIKLNPNIVNLIGPKSVIERIVKATVTINLDDRDSSLQGAVPVTLLDAKDQPVTDKDLKVTPTAVNMTVPITFKLNAKTVPIRVVTIGSPAPGYIAGSSVKTDPTLVTINGDPNDLGSIEYVETKPVDLNNANTTVVTVVQLRAPENTVLSTKTVTVQIGITVAQASVPIRVPVEVINPPVLRYEIRPTMVTITLQGPYQLLQPRLPLDQIKVTVDLTGVGVGNFELPLQVQTPDGLVATDLPKISVIVLAPPRPTATPLPLPTPTPTVAPTNSTNTTTIPSTVPDTVPPPANTATPQGTVSNPTTPSPVPNPSVPIPTSASVARPSSVPSSTPGSSTSTPLPSPKSSP